MHFQFNLPEGGKKNTFRDNEVTNKVPLMFLNAQLLTQKVQIAFFRLCQQTSKIFSV